jgi:single-strand DNA-binding protein
MRYAPSGQPVASFPVAVNRQHPGISGESVKETLWFRVSTWGKQAEICNEHLRKGSQVLVVGRLVGDAETGGPRLWQRQNGEPAASFEVYAETIRFLGSRSAAGQPEVVPQEELNIQF